MFDITSSKLLILAVVALIVVGPKDLPILLRTVGKYLGVIRRQAAEFRSHFDEAMREAELDQLKKEFEAAAREVHATVESGTRSLEARAEPASAPKPEPLKFGTGMPTPPAEPETEKLPSPDVAIETKPEATAERADVPGRGAA